MALVYIFGDLTSLIKKTKNTVIKWCFATKSGKPQRQLSQKLCCLSFTSLNSEQEETKVSLKRNNPEIEYSEPNNLMAFCSIPLREDVYTTYLAQ